MCCARRDIDDWPQRCQPTAQEHANAFTLPQPLFSCLNLVLAANQLADTPHQPSPAPTTNHITSLIAEHSPGRRQHPHRHAALGRD